MVAERNTRGFRTQVKGSAGCHPNFSVLEYRYRYRYRCRSHMQRYRFRYQVPVPGSRFRLSKAIIVSCLVIIGLFEIAAWSILSEVKVFEPLVQVDRLVYLKVVLFCKCPRCPTI